MGDAGKSFGITFGVVQSKHRHLTNRILGRRITILRKITIPVSNKFSAELKQKHQKMTEGQDND